jgi:hypothetical protein
MLNRTILLVVVIIFSSIRAESQIVKTKDGFALGDRSIFMKSCIEGVKVSTININGLQIEAKKYCSCLCDNLLPTLTLEEITYANQNNKMVDLMMKGNNFEILKQCVQASSKIDDDFEFGSGGNKNLQIKIGVKFCVDEALKSQGSDKILTRPMMEKYCDCAVKKLYADGYKYKDLEAILDQNSKAFNEVVVPCIAEVLSDKGLEKSKFHNKSDIIGVQSKSIVPLINYFGSSFKVKITIGGITKYFLFDTGASQLIIDRDFERELLIAGYLKKENYTDKSSYELANNESVVAQNLKVNGVKIGDYTLNNVKIAVMDNGSLICGTEFLSKFRNWEFDKEKKVLVLYK